MRSKPRPCWQVQIFSHMTKLDGEMQARQEALQFEEQQLQQQKHEANFQFWLSNRYPTCLQKSSQLVSWWREIKIAQLPILSFD